MNKENLRKLIDTLKAVPEYKYTGLYASHGFNMRYYFHDCGTPSCIAGFAAALQIRPDLSGSGEVAEFNLDQIGLARMHERVSDFLGINYRQEAELFIPKFLTKYFTQPVLYHDIAKEKAIMVLEHLLSTGVVDWRVAYPELTYKLSPEEEEEFQRRYGE